MTEKESTENPGNSFMAIGAGLEFVGRGIVSRVDFVGLEFIEQIILPMQYSHMRPEEFIRRDTTQQKRSPYWQDW